jgi:hypothetical protein
MSIKYTKELLNSYCQDNNIVLIKDYSNEKIWCELSLEGNCSNNDCINTFKKSFKHLIKNGSLCRQCNKSKNKNCVIFNLKLLQSYCSEKNIKLDKEYSKEKLGASTKISGICENTDCENNFDCKFRNLIQFGGLCKNCFYKKRTSITKKSNKEKYGVEFISQVPEIRQKAEETMVEKYGVKYTTQSKELYEKMKNNNMDKYGVEFISQVPEVRQKAKNTNMERYGVEYTFQSDLVQEKSKNTIKEKYGVEFVSQVPEVRQKAKNTNMERYGVEYATQSDIVKEKTIQTNLTKYGVEFVSQVPEVRQKAKNTNMERYGVEYATQSDIVKEKTIQTNLTKYGVENPSQNENIKIKKEETCMKNYGVKSSFQMEETKQKNRLVMIENKKDIIEKSKNTCLEKYGVEHPAQNPEIMAKCSKNAYKLKDYILPSGNIIKIQGYENYALDELLQDGILEEDIVNGCKNVPEIWYEDVNKIKHRHYVDIFISSQNRCIEIKSTWTAEKKKDCIFLKQKAGKELGYQYEIWVYNKKGEKVENYK